MWLSAQVLVLLPRGGLADSPLHLLRLIVLLALFAASYFVLNTGMIAAAVALQNRCSPLKVWRAHFFGLWLTYFGGGAAAGLVFLLLYTTTSNLALLGVLLPLPLVLYVAFRHSMGRLDDQLRHLADLNSLYLSTIEALAQAIDAKDHFTHGHIRRVQMYAGRLARELGMPDQECKAIDAAALLHDMGKIGVPEHILNKPGKLTNAEYEKVKMHAALGADILSSIKFPYPVVPIVRHHHERWDGRGYPDGLAATGIPLGARLLAVVDCFDALTTNRPYRPALSDDEAAEVLRSERGKSYDPRVVDAFLNVFREVAVHEGVPVLPEGTMDAVARTFHSAPAAADLKPAAVHDDLAAVHDDLAAVFLDVGAALAQARNADEVGRAVWDCVSVMMPATSCVLYLTDAPGETLRAAFTAGDHAPTLSGITLPLGHALSGWVAANRCTMVNADALLDVAGLAVALDPPLHTCLSSPIASDAATLGTLTLYSSATSAFSDRHGRLLEALAARAALALARLHSRAA
jgi:putative nucleotidyltransferase with HDIG domain